MSAVKGSCSLLDSKRFHGILTYEMNPNIFDIIQHPKLERIQTYLLSEEGANKQLENAIYHSLERDKAIDFYIERITDSNIRKKLHQKNIKSSFNIYFKRKIRVTLYYFMRGMNLMKVDL